MIAKAQSRPAEVLRSGHAGCPGCGHAMGMRMVLQALGNRAVVVVVPSCVAVISGPYPHAALNVPVFHSAFEIAAPTAAGISQALKMQGKDNIPVLAFLQGTAAPLTLASNPSPVLRTGTRTSFTSAWTTRRT